MARGDATYARIDVTFWADARVQTMNSAEALAWYYAAWCVAVELRRETLPEYVTAEIIGRRAYLDPEQSKRAFALCVDQRIGLVGQNGNGRIQVFGVRRRHSKLPWKEGVPDTPPIADPYAPDKSTKGDIEEKRRGEKRREVLKTCLARFAEFWGAYPPARQVNRRGAVKAWTARIREGVSVEQILLATRNYAEKIRREKPGVLERSDPAANYILHPTTFLNGRWEDFIAPESGGPPDRHRGFGERDYGGGARA